MIPNFPFNALDKWSKMTDNGLAGPKISRADQQKIANITEKRKYKALYRGTVVSKENLKTPFKIFTIPRLQSWSTNKNTAIDYTNFMSNETHKKNKIKVVFYTTTTTDKVKSYKLNNKIFSNRNIEVIVNRPVFKAYFDEKNYDSKKKIYFVPIEFIESHNEPIVPNSNKKETNNTFFRKIRKLMIGK